MTEKNNTGKARRIFDEVRNIKDSKEIFIPKISRGLERFSKMVDKAIKRSNWILKHERRKFRRFFKLC